MESYRHGYRMRGVPRSQAGITVLGFLIIATLLGVVGLGAIKVTPMYLQNMRLSTILTDVKRDLDGKGADQNSIRYALAKRFSIEDIDLPRDNLKISQSRDGYSVRIQYENRAPYFADIWLVVAFDKQVEIRR